MTEKSIQAPTHEPETKSSGKKVKIIFNYCIEISK